jgi:hypothetical protein
MGMKMQIVTIAIACLGLLSGVEPTSAQQTHLLTVGIHQDVSSKLSANKVDKILAEASKVLKQCNVILKRSGSVGTFRSPNRSGTVENATDRDAVHREKFDIKVLGHPLDVCRVKQQQAVGCAWDPAPGKDLPQHRSVIITYFPKDLKFTGMILAHEFGHRTGLPHRNEKNALMKCEVDKKSARLNEHECNCFLGGPGSCPDPVEAPEQCKLSRR